MARSLLLVGAGMAAGSAAVYDVVGSTKRGAGGRPAVLDGARLDEMENDVEAAR